MSTVIDYKSIMMKNEIEELREIHDTLQDNLRDLLNEPVSEWVENDTAKHINDTQRELRIIRKFFEDRGIFVMIKIPLRP